MLHRDRRLTHKKTRCSCSVELNGLSLLDRCHLALWLPLSNDFLILLIPGLSAISSLLSSLLFFWKKVHEQASLDICSETEMKEDITASLFLFLLFFWPKFSYPILTFD